MLYHIGFPVSDYERAKAFYMAALAPLGYTLIMEVGADKTESAAPAAGFGANGKADFWIGGEGGVNRPLHVAIAAKDWATVDAFYASMRPRSPRAAATTELPDCVRTITRITMAHSSSTRTGTTSRRCVTPLRELARAA
jgi:hypothetical protein